MIRSTPHSLLSKHAHTWRAIDLGHHSVRWLDRNYPLPSLADSDPQSFHSLPENNETESHRLTLDRLALCELSSLVQVAGKREEIISSSQLFESWQSLDQLMTSPFLGALSLVDKSDGALWVNTVDGEFTPQSLLSRWLSDSLTPAITIGEEAQRLTQSLIWLTSSGRLPSVSSFIYRCLSELPYANGASLNSAVATLIGLSELGDPPLKSGVWGVLDVGEGQASWSLIEVTASDTQSHKSYRVLKSYGRSFVGGRGLRRALLSHHLNTKQVSWTRLDHQSRVEWVDYVSTQAENLIKHSWPRYLKPSSALNVAYTETDQSVLELYQRYYRGTYLGVIEWIKHSLDTTNIGPEALRGMYVTGKSALGLSIALKRRLSAVNIRIAPHRMALVGAQKYVNRTLYSEECGYHVEEVSPFALILRDDHEKLSKVIFSEQSPLPSMHELNLGPTAGTISLWLSNYGDHVEKIAEHPPIDQGRKLHLYYEGPHLIELSWAGGDDLETALDNWTYT